MKRNVAGILWLAVGWTIGSMLSLGYGLPGVLAPVLGVALAAVVIRDPLGRIWGPKEPKRTSSQPQPAVPQAG